MYISKFPVSYMGKEYRVDIYTIESNLCHNIFVDVFIERNKRWNIFKYKKVHGRVFDREWNGRFKELAEFAVVDYVKLVKHKKICEDKIIRGRKEFENWDGAIK